MEYKTQMLTAIAEVHPLKAVWISGMFPVKKLAASKGPHKQGRNTPFLVTSPSQNTNIPIRLWARASPRRTYE